MDFDALSPGRMTDSTMPTLNFCKPGEFTGGRANSRREQQMAIAVQWIIFAFLCAVWSISTPVRAADERSIHWDALEVDARLDADGRLHVSELHRMVFDGAWNGGERRFYLGENQDLDLEALVRIDAQATEHRLAEGDLEQVDNYAWSDGNTLRWRARLPDDPPFHEDILSYRIDYVLAGILQYTGDGYVLDHDFAFADRPGEIRRFRLRLTLDPVWTPEETIAPEFEAQHLEPGTGWVLRRTLRYTGSTLPRAVHHGALPLTRTLLLQGMIVGGGLMFVVFLWREARAGRFRRLIPLKNIDRAWIERHVLAHPPEVVGALWDGRLGAAEVAAVLARMTQEGKLGSRVETRAGWLFKKHRLHLTLKVPRDTLPGHERALVDALFFDGDETNTDKVRAHYRPSGFNPADAIEEAVENHVRRIAGPAPPYSRHGRYFMWIVLAQVLVMPVHFVYGVAADVVAGVIALFATFFFFMFGFNAASVYRGTLGFPLTGIVYFVIAATFSASPVVVLLLDNPALNSAYLLIEIMILWFLLIGTMLLAARTRTQPKEREQQHRLRSARAWFAAELAKPDPELEDAWYPYLLAFGLGSDVDRWFGAFGGTAVARSGGISRDDARGVIPSASAWSGGGGSFGGGGASGTWALAADGLASSIAAPSSGSSSSNSSSSSGGRSSSGGGGGGAW